MSEGMVGGDGGGGTGGVASSPAPSAPSAVPSAGAPKTTSTVPSGGPKATSTLSSSPAAATGPNSKFAEQATPGAAPTGATSAAEKAERQARKLKLKVDGGEEEVDLDKWMSRSDDEIARDLQMAKAARRRMSEAAEQRKQVEEVLSLFKKDPWAAAQHLGMDLDSLAEQRLAEKYREQTLPEHERKALDLQRQLEAREKELHEIRTTEQRRVQETMDREVFEQTEREFKAALDLTGLPQSNETLYMMAEIANTALQHGIELTPEQMATEVRERLGEQSKYVFSQMKGPRLLDYLGEEVVKEVMRARLSQIRKPTPAPVPTPAPGQATMIRSEEMEARRPGSKQHMTPQQFRKLMRG